MQEGKTVKTPYYRGLGIGFLAGFVGLAVHGIGANTFIIVRIMEPFWFFVGIIAAIPMLVRQRADRSHEAEVTGRAATARYVSTAR